MIKKIIIGVVIVAGVLLCFMVWQRIKALPYNTFIVNNGGTTIQHNTLSTAPATASAEKQQSSVNQGFLTISAPHPGEAVSSPVTVSGYVAVHAMLNIMIVDDKGTTLANKTVPFSSAGGGYFQEAVAFSPPATAQGAIELSLINTNGKHYNVMLLPLVFQH